MFKLFKSVVGLFSLGILGLLGGLIIIAIILSIGAAFWGWILMLIMGATGHAWFGYHEAFLWGYLIAACTGS